MKADRITTAAGMVAAFVAVALLSTAAAGAAENDNPYESGTAFAPINRIDELLLEGLRKQKIEPAGLCSDAVFFRRVHLDLTGTLPDPRKIHPFLNDRRPEKYRQLIDELMRRGEFADYWTHKWGDALRIKAEFPINLWPNGVQAYSRWVYEAVRGNMPYDRFARALLTSSGSNFRVPPVNFYRALQGQEPPALAAAVALTFMGARFEQWPAQRQKDTAVFFSRVAYKKTAEWKEEIVYLDPAPAGPLKTAFPDGKKVVIRAGEDPRRVFADWLIRPENPWFARCAVNRIWAWLLGRGIVHEPDDIRPENPAAHPKILAYLAKELAAADYDLRHIFRLIANSATYRQSSIPRGGAARAEQYFACYPVRRLDAEVLIDALNRIAGASEAYSSVIPEPYTFIPAEERSIELEDGSITSQFLEMFGRPSRDTGMHTERNNTPTDAQSLHLLNSSTIQNKITRSWRLRMLMQRAKGDTRKLITMLYHVVLSRPPTADEIGSAEKYMKQKGIGTRNGAVDLAWALINAKEFLYRH